MREFFRLYLEPLREISLCEAEYFLSMLYERDISGKVSGRGEYMKYFYQFGGEVSIAIKGIFCRI